MTIFKYWFCVCFFEKFNGKLFLGPNDGLKVKHESALLSNVLFAVFKCVCYLLHFIQGYNY